MCECCARQEATFGRPMSTSMQRIKNRQADLSKAARAEHREQQHRARRWCADCTPEAAGGAAVDLVRFSWAVHGLYLRCGAMAWWQSMPCWLKGITKMTGFPDGAGNAHCISRRRQ
jgi:hypothetical protein